MLVIGLYLSHPVTGSPQNSTFDMFDSCHKDQKISTVEWMEWPGLFKVVQQDGDVLLIFLAGVEICRCCHSICHGVFQIIKIIDPEGATLVPKRILPKHRRPRSELSQGTVVFLKICHNFFGFSSFTMVYGSWSMLNTWNRTSGAVQLTDSALIMFSKSEGKPSGLTSQHGQKVHPRNDIK